MGGGDFAWKKAGDSNLPDPFKVPSLVMANVQSRFGPNSYTGCPDLHGLTFNTHILTMFSLTEITANFECFSIPSCQI